MKTRETNSVVNNVIIAFKDHCRLKKITPYRLSLMADVSKSSISKIGNFEQSPTFSMMIKLSVAAEFDLPQALSQNYPYPESELVQNELLGKDPLFYSAVKKLSPQQLKLACKILADIAEG